MPDKKGAERKSLPIIDNNEDDDRLDSGTTTKGRRRSKTMSRREMMR